tara:strand:- start:170 stop:664 length:495 start_codon:yes stop_codon:yes gene_type:complete
MDVGPDPGRAYANPGAVGPDPGRAYKSPDVVGPDANRIYGNPDSVGPNPEGFLGGFLRRFLDMDEKYADAVRAQKMFPMESTSIRNTLEGAPLREIVRQFRENPEGLSTMDNYLDKGVHLASNVAVRYGLPAAGVTLAGKGLYDLTVAFGGGADQQERGQLPLA